MAAVELCMLYSFPFQDFTMQPGGGQKHALGKAILVHAAGLPALCLPLHALCRQIGCDNQWWRLHSA